MGVGGNFGTETNGAVEIFLEEATDTVQTLEMTNLWCSAESPHRHGRTVNVVTSKRDRPLEGSDKALVMFDIFRACFFSGIKFQVIIFVNWRCVFFRRRTKDGFALVDDAFAVSLGSPCKCAIRDTIEISTEMVGYPPNSLEFVLAVS